MSAMPSPSPLRVLLLSVALSAACKPSAAPAPPTPQVAPASGIPGSLHGYRLTGTEPIDIKVGGGHLYRFRDSTKAYITVFVYPVPDDVKQSPDSAQWVATEGHKFAAILPILVQRGQFDTYEMAFENPDTVVAGNHPVVGFRAVAVTRARGRVEVQYEFLHLVRGEFVKVRATVPQEDWEQAPIIPFAHDLVAAMLKPTAEPRH